MWRSAIRTALFGAMVVGWCVGFGAMADEPSAAGSVEQPDYEAAFAAEEYPQTIAAATHAIEGDPECAEAFSKRGRAHARLEEFDAATADCQQAVTLDPRNAEYREHLACLCHVAGNLDAALEHYCAAIDLGARDYLAFSNRGALYLQKGLLPQALADLNEAIRLDPTKALAYANRSGVYCAREEYDLALDDANEAIRLASRLAVGFLNRGNAHGGKQDYTCAVSDMTRAIELDPNCTKAYLGRSKAYLALGQLDEAMQDVRRAIELAPERASHYQQLASVQYRRRELSEAIESLSEAIRLAPADATAFLVRSILYLEKEKFDRALADAQEAVRLAPDDARGYAQRGCAFGYKGNYEQAVSDATEAIRLQASFSGAYALRAHSQKALRKLDEAIADFSKVIELGPEDARTYVCRGDCYFNQREYDKALADYNKAIGLDASSPFAYERRGAIWLLRGGYDRGLAEIETAVRLNPSDPAATFVGAPEPVDDEALEHGEQQVQQMLEDRPAMGQYGEGASVLYQWAARMFAQKHGQQRIFWDAREPVGESDAASYIPREGKPGYIRVRSKYSRGPKAGEERSFEDLWHNVVFELHNVNNAESHQQVKTRANAGDLTRDEYAKEMIDSEARAAESTRAFYIHVYLPWAKEHKISTNPSLWFVGWRSGPNDNLLRGRFMKTPYWQHYERGHDLIALRSLAEEGEYRDLLETAMGIAREKLTREQNDFVGRCTVKALYSLMVRGSYQETVDFAEKLPSQSQTDRERCLIRVYTGYCLARLGRLSDAVDAYDDAIRLDPTQADAYQGRASAHVRLGNTKQAIADASEAIRLCPSDASRYTFRAGLYEQIGYQDHAESDHATAKTLAEFGNFLK